MDILCELMKIETIKETIRANEAYIERLKIELAEEEGKLLEAYEGQKVEIEIRKEKDGSAKIGIAKGADK